MEEGASQLIFIEVRYRSKDNYGSHVGTITQLKQARIRRTAAHFLLSHSEYQTFACRFDVIGLIESPQGHLADAWGAHGRPFLGYPGVTGIEKTYTQARDLNLLP